MFYNILVTCKNVETYQHLHDIITTKLSMLYYNVTSYKSVIPMKYDHSCDGTKKSLINDLKALHSSDWRSASIAATGCKDLSCTSVRQCSGWSSDGTDVKLPRQNPWAASPLNHSTVLQLTVRHPRSVVG